MTKKLSISLERWGAHGWAWDMTYPVEDYGDGITEGHSRMRTDGNGDGLWSWVASGATWYPDGGAVMEWKQQLGTCQFHLPSSRRQAYQKIYNEWGRE